MKATGKNNTTTLLTNAKRMTLAFLIMASFTLAIANIHFAEAQRVEFILQFGAPEEDSITIAVDVSADSSGNVYVVGFTDDTLPGQTSEGEEDAFIRKYNSDGDEIWTRQFGTSEFDVASGVSVDSSGDVYVVGSTRGTLPDQTSEDGRDAFIRKYNSDGDEIWTRQFGTSENDSASGVSVDSSGDVYVAGNTEGTFEGETRQGGLDMFVRKYNSDGDEIWTRQFGTSEENESALDVSADLSGNVYVVGVTEGTLPGQTSEGEEDAFIRKYNSDGDEIWTRQFGTSEFDVASGVSVDSSGDAYVAGSTHGTFPGQTDEENDDAVFIRKYDSDGDEIWTRQFVIEEGVIASGVSVDSSSGNVYVGGIQIDAVFIFVRNYNLDGDEIWTRQFDTASSEDSANGVSADESGGVYIVGDTEGAFPGQTQAGSTDAFLAKIVDEDDDGDDKRKRHHDDDNDKKKHHDDDKRKKKH